MRSALGAGRGRLVRQLLVESLLLALGGGGTGAFVAWGAVASLRRLGAGSVPRLNEAAVDARLLAVALGLSVVVGVLFGLLPALRQSRADLGAVLKEGARGTHGGGSAIACARRWWWPRSRSRLRCSSAPVFSSTASTACSRSTRASKPSAC